MAAESSVATATATHMADKQLTDVRHGDLLKMSHTPHTLPEDIFNDSLTGDG